MSNTRRYETNKERYGGWRPLVCRKRESLAQIYVLLAINQNDGEGRWQKPCTINMGDMVLLTLITS